MQNHRKPFQTLPEMFDDDDDVDIGLLQSYHSSKIELLFRSPDLEYSAHLRNMHQDPPGCQCFDEPFPCTASQS